MRYHVLQEFNTLTRRFKPGMEIDGTEIDSVVTIDRWLHKGVIKVVKPAQPDFVSDQATMKSAWAAARGRPSSRSRATPRSCSR